MADDDQVMGILSELPEPIIHHILSFLTIKQATRASALSKAWLSAWRTRPTLEFDCNLLIANDLDPPNFQYRNRMELMGMLMQSNTKYRKGLQYMRSTLLRYLDQKIGLETFNLSITPFFFGEGSLVAECIDLAVQNGVKNLHLFTPAYLLPQKVLEAKSLVSLSIMKCVLKEQEVRCYRLKRLNLHRAEINEQVLENIMSSCQLIEHLEVVYCNGFANFKVTKLRYLKQLTALLFTDQRVEVEAPSLELLTCRNERPRLMVLESWLNLSASQYQNLRSLTLSALEISVKFFANMASKFPHLEDLRIQYCQNLRRIKISSHSLKKILLADNKELEVAQFHVPSIHRFEYNCNYWLDEMKPELLFTAASSSWTSHINISLSDSVDSSWFLKLREFLRRLIPSEISIRMCFTGHVTYSVDVMENSATLPEPQEIKEFWVNIFEELSSSSVLSALDNIFWTCHPHIIWHVYNKSITKLIYDMLMFRKNRGQPNLQNFKKFKFWQHDLMDVKVDIFKYGMLPNRGKLDFVKIGRGVQLPEALDWEDFYKVLNAQEDKRLICFNLEWRKSEMHNKAKRLKT